MPTSGLKTRPSGQQRLRGIATRAKLIAVAEQLFAERGIEGVTLMDINKRGGQSNRNASHYHFGSKEGLIQAILDKHIPGIINRRNQLLDEIEKNHKASVQEVVRALLYPVAEKLFDSDGGCEFIRINAHLVSSYAASLGKGSEYTFDIDKQERLKKAMQQVLHDLPTPIARQRGLMAAVLIFDGLANHSRVMQRSKPVSNTISLTELFIHNMEDCLIALLQAPVSKYSASLAGSLNTKTSTRNRA